MDSGECVVAPSTPNPPARLTAATTSRQWLKANRGNSIPSMSQSGDFMVVVSPCGSPGCCLLLILSWCGRTLAHPGQGSQAGAAATPLNYVGLLRKYADRKTRFAS